MKSSFLLALNLMLKKFPMHIIMILQLTITILLLVMMIGRVQFVEDSAKTTQSFSGQNAFYFMRYQYIDSSFKIDDYLSQLGIASFSIGEIGNLALRDNDDQIIIAYGYNDTIINSCDFELSRGVWFTESSSDNVPVITIGNRYNVGDVINASTLSDNIGYTLEVIGKLEQNSYIITFDTSSSRGASTVDQFISHPRNELIVPYSSSNYKSIDKTSNPNYIEIEKSLAEIIVFEDKYPIDYITNILSKYGHTTFITDMLSNYDALVNNELVIYTIVCLVFTALTLIGIGGNNGIQNMLNEHQYVIYYMLGASQKKCVWIEAIRSALLIVISLILALLLRFLFPSLYPASSMRITALTWAIILIYLVFVFLVTSGIFLYRLGKKNLAATYKEQA